MKFALALAAVIIALVVPSMAHAAADQVGCGVQLEQGGPVIDGKGTVVTTKSGLSMVICHAKAREAGVAETTSGAGSSAHVVTTKSGVILVILKTVPPDASPGG